MLSNHQKQNSEPREVDLKITVSLENYNCGEILLLLKEQKHPKKWIEQKDVFLKQEKSSRRWRHHLKSKLLLLNREKAP